MAYSDETIQFVRNELSKAYGDHKIIVAPCSAEVYTSKTKDFLKKPSDVKWKLVSSGLVAVVYNTKENRERLMLCLASPKTATIIWKETIVPFTIIDCPHPTFHTLTSARNFHERAGILYENKSVARLVFQVMTMFTSHNQSPSSSTSRKVQRSLSFSVASRTTTRSNLRGMKSTFEICTLALSKITIQQAFSTQTIRVSDPMIATVCASPRHSPQELIPTQKSNVCRTKSHSALLTTDLCTTEL